LSMTFWWGVVKELASQGPLGVVVAFQPLSAIVSIPLVYYAWRKSGPLFPRPLLGVLVLIAGGWAAAVALIVQSRAAYVDGVLELTPVDPSAKATWIAAYVAWDIDAQLMAGATALLAMPLLGTILTVRAARAGRGLRTTLPIAASAISIAVTGLGLCWNALEKQVWGCGISPHDRYELLVASYWPLSLARWVVVSAAAAAAVTMMMASLRRRPTQISSTAALVLAVPALAAWVLMRGMAHDGSHPLPFDDRFEVFALPATQSLPVATHCERVVDAPIVVVAEDGVSVDGAPAGGPQAAGATLAAKHELWAMLHPDQPFPGVVIIAAAPELPLAEVRSFLDVAREAGYFTAHALVAHPRDWQTTRTLGRVERTRRGCIGRIPTQLAERGTWGELVALAQGG
ncbi:MAG: hypothetical protein ACYC6C_12935, partial [Coriobacteriia bacterium]